MALILLADLARKTGMHPGAIAKSVRRFGFKPETVRIEGRAQLAIKSADAEKYLRERTTADIARI